jgi:hypothetical protein
MVDEGYPEASLRRLRDLIKTDKINKHHFITPEVPLKTGAEFTHHEINYSQQAYLSHPQSNILKTSYNIMH